MKFHRDSLCAGDRKLENEEKKNKNIINRHNGIPRSQLGKLKKKRKSKNNRNNNQLYNDSLNLSWTDHKNHLKTCRVSTRETCNFYYFLFTVCTFTPTGENTHTRAQQLTYVVFVTMNVEQKNPINLIALQRGKQFAFILFRLRVLRLRRSSPIHPPIRIHLLAPPFFSRSPQTIIPIRALFILFKRSVLFVFISEFNSNVKTALKTDR